MKKTRQQNMWWGALVLVLLAALFVHNTVDLQRDAKAGQPPMSQHVQQVVDGPMQCLGFHQYTTLSAVLNLSDVGTYTIPVEATVALIQAEGQNVRWRDAPRVAGNTTDPTSSVGMIIYAGDVLVYNGDLKSIYFIEEAGGAKLNVSFYGP